MLIINQQVFLKIKAKVQLYLMNRMDVADSDYFSENTSQKGFIYIKWEHELGKLFIM